MLEIKIYNLSAPLLNGKIIYGYFSVRGTWTYLRPPCKTCGYYWQHRTRPLLVEWEKSSTSIGDFSWDGIVGELFLVTKKVKKILSAHFSCSFSRPKYFPAKETSRTVIESSSCDLFWCEPKPVYDACLNRSNIAMISSCVVCNHMVYESKRSGFVIPAKNWHDEHLFKIASNGSRYAFVTEQGKAILESITPTNIAFVDAGEIVE